MSSSHNLLESRRIKSLLRILLFLLCIQIKRATAYTTTYPDTTTETTIVNTDTTSPPLTASLTTTLESSSHPEETFDSLNSTEPLDLNIPKLIPKPPNLSVKPGSQYCHDIAANVTLISKRNKPITPLGASLVHEVVTDSMFAVEQDRDVTLPCRSIYLFTYINDPNCMTRREKQPLDRMRTRAAKNVTHVIWHKDDRLFHRANGNITPNSTTPNLRLFDIGISDIGRYTCYPNFSNIDPDIYKYFHVHSALSFGFVLEERRSMLPDQQPTISHPPGDLVVNKGSNVTFTCNRINTMAHQTTFWFKMPFKNETEAAISKFMEAFNQTEASGTVLPLHKYFIRGHHDDKFYLDDVSEVDAGYYGCAVVNIRGIDIRLGSLKLFDTMSVREHGNIDSNSVVLMYCFGGLSISLVVVLIIIFLVSSFHKIKKEDKTDQSKYGYMVDKEKNPYISSNNTNSDEASSWGKSMSSHGDSSRAFYLHTSNTTTTTVPLYDHPPVAGSARLCEAIVQDACAINPSYGFISAEPKFVDWNFPRRNLERLDKIGEGQFGEVWRYIARQKDGTEQHVAVKQLKNRVGFDDRERLELISEIEIMKLVCDHPNVIRLMNYCVDDHEQPILLIMEYAENGKLQTYLRGWRAPRSSFNNCDSYSLSITSKELIKFAYHVAKGMEYVASKGIVHRDLASRNILVSKDRVCKVADFGFARRLNDDCAYERSTASPVPVKWMAPEALVENRFTTKSDVFSMGILMWEIVTLGATPYEYMTSPEVYKKVTTGGRLQKPAHCKDEFYNIMAACWHHDPSQRPSFKELSFQLEKLLLSEHNYIELDQYPESAYYNILNTAEKEVVYLD